MKNIKKIMIFQFLLAVTVLLLFENIVFAAPVNSQTLKFSTPVAQIDKTLYLKANVSHLLTFDEKIIRYKFDNNDSCQAEILQSIFNSGHEMLIKPVKKLDNKLTLWTKSKVYIFNIKLLQDKPEDSKSCVLPEDNYGMADFDLDIPPEIKKN